MFKKKIDDNLIRVILIAFLFFILHQFILLPVGVFRAIRLGPNDFFFNISRFITKPSETINKITVVKIDEETLYKAEKKWPWDRIFFAEIINKISDYNPKVIAMDITFFGKSTNQAEDDIMAESIKKAGNVILAAYITEKGDLAVPYSPFKDACYGYGFVNKTGDPDLKIRQARLIYKKPSYPKPYFSFEIAAAAAYLGKKPDDISLNENNIVIKDGLSIPLSEEGTIYIDYTPIRLVQSVSLLDLLQDTSNLKDFINGKIVLLGTTSKTTHDIYQTQRGLISGVYINALTLNTILKKVFIKDLPVNILFIIILSLVLLTAILTYRLSLSKGIMFITVEIAFILAFFIAAGAVNIKLDYFSVLFTVLSCYIVTDIYKYGYLLYLNNRLKKMVITDSLSGLATARYFQFRLQLDISKTSGAKAWICIVVFYIPELQGMAKKYKIEELELVLRQLGIILKQNSRKKVDLLCRWKETSFATILLKTDKDEAGTYAQKIISKIEQNEFMLADKTIRLNVYAGISNYPYIKTESAGGLINCAETAANRAKSLNQKICVFDPKLDKVKAEIFQKKPSVMEQDYLTLDIADREKELLETLNELRKSQDDIQKAHFETILSLVKALEEKDPYTAGHSARVADYAIGIAKHLNLDESDITLIRQSALLHDIGKFGLPDKILNKKEALTPDEMDQIKRHPVMGARILEKSKFFENHIPLVLHHHERFDGKGYPHGLSGKFIPKGAQIIAIADAMDAMTTGRGYNHVLSIEETIAELKKYSGTQFDPDYIQSAIDYLSAAPKS